MDIQKISSQFNKEWENLSVNYFTKKTEGSIWMMNRNIAPDDPEQGWKIHISATVLNASEILKKTGPLLQETGVLFKAAISLYELQKLNCGLFYGFSQIGKFMTVYPRNIKEALFLAEKLQLITEDYICPTVPFDNSFRGSRCIYYRYGSFSLNIKNEDGTLVSAIRDKNGNLVPDKRESGSAVPNWLEDPFLEKTQNIDVQKFPSDSYIRAYEAISQRGKGGVFLAIDLSYAPARKCILKEGRKNGEVEWDGKDGHWRIQHEAVVLDELAKKEIKVAELYSTFEAASNYYIVTEFIEGVTLQSILNKKLNIEDYLSYGYQISEIMYKIHEAGWVWRDCKPMNIIKSLEGCLRPIDFEGACRADASNEIPWGTPGYVPPEWLNDNISKVPEDLYALGVTLHQLISGHIPTTGQLKPLGKCRYNVPITIRNIVSQLLNPDPTKRPSAMSVLNIFENELSKAIETNKISMII